MEEWSEERIPHLRKNRMQRREKGERRKRKEDGKGRKETDKR